MKNNARRRYAAFFLSVFSCWPAHSWAALIPVEPSNSNLNSRSTRPVELKRDPNFQLPDISDIFEGYSVDELPPDIPTSASPALPPADDGLLILELRLGKSILNDALIGYSKRGSLMLPLGGLADSLQLPIRLDLPIGQAEGWFPKEDRSFKLDSRRRLVTIAGQVDNIPESLIEIKSDDIYVDISLLSDWFLLDFNFSFAEQVVAVDGKNNVLLPVERLAKLQLAREALRLRPTDQSDSYPLKRSPYQLATLPFADLAATYDYDERSTPTDRLQGNLLTHGDLLYMNHSSYIAYNERTGLQDVRLTLSRKDPNGQLFYGDDPLSSTWLAEKANEAELTEFTIGDIYSQQMPLTMLNQNGRGMIISNQPLNRADQYDRTSISGDIQPNWEVELYRNEELLAFQQSAANGRYEFVDVPLLTGLNIFRLVFYGPFGETREEIRRIVVNQNITKKGESYVRLMVMEQGKNLVNSGNQSVNFSSSLFGTTGNNASTNTRGMERIGFEYEYGLMDQMALYMQASHIPISSTDTTNAASVGLAGVWQEIYGRVDLAQSDDGGHAAEFIAQTNQWGVNLSARHQWFDEFYSDYTEDLADPVAARTIIRADTSIKLPILPRLSLGIAGAETDYESGRQRRELNQRTTTTLFGRASLNHNVTFTQDYIPIITTGPLEFTRGNALVSVPLWGAYLRGGANYSISPDTQLDSVSLTADYSLTPDILLRGDYLRQIGPSRHTLVASLSRRFKNFSIGVNAGGTSDGELLAGLSFNTGFGFEPRTGDFRSYAEPLSRLGIISAQSFVDSNNNSVLDLGEKTVPADYLVNNGPGSRRSHDQVENIQLIKNITPYDVVPVTVNPSSLDNPFLVAGDSNVRAIARPGTPMQLDFPLKPAADVEGIVILEQNGAQQPAANVLVEAVDKEGRVVRSAKTAFDGIYLMELLPIGEYELRVSEDQADRLGFLREKPQPLTVQATDEYIQNIDFTIRR